jgi:hypothetical protein
MPEVIEPGNAVTWDAIREIDEEHFVAAAGRIRILKDGVYNICGQFAGESKSGITGQKIPEGNISLMVENNAPGVAWKLIPNGGYCHTSFHWTMSLKEGDVVSVRLTCNAALNVLQDGYHMTIHRI